MRMRGHMSWVPRRWAEFKGPSTAVFAVHCSCSSVKCAYLAASTFVLGNQAALVKHKTQGVHSTVWDNVLLTSSTPYEWAGGTIRCSRRLIPGADESHTHNKQNMMRAMISPALPTIGIP